MYMIKSYKKLLVNYKTYQIKVLKVLKTIRKVLKSVRKSPPPEHLHHAETSQPTYYANKLLSCNTPP